MTPDALPLPRLTSDEAVVDAFLDALEKAGTEALADHVSGRCADSEWSCSYCEAETQ